MDFLRRLYDWNERTFWNSLTKKLMSFLLLFFIDLAYLGIYLQQKRMVAEEMGRAGVSAEVMQRVSAGMDHGLMLLIGLTVVALGWNILQILYIRFLILRPVRMIATIFDEIGRGEGDFSRNLPTITHDELRSLAEAYNLRGLIAMRLGDMRLAEESFQRALQLRPREPDTSHNMGWLMCSQGRYVEANGYFEQALASPIYTHKPKTHMAQGLCEMKAGKLAEGAHHLLDKLDND